MHRAEYAFDVAVITTTTRLSPYRSTNHLPYRQKACKLLISILSVWHTMCIAHKQSQDLKRQL